jgi:chromosome segregation protein
MLGGTVFGKLGDLGRIHPKYDKAISAVGGQFNSILVENDMVASQAINYLKRSRLGRCQFMPLNKIQIARSAMNQPFRPP